MANVTLIPVHGYVNTSHISTLTPYYPAGSLPMPWPLLVLSIIISLVVCCLNCKSAFVSLKTIIPQKGANDRRPLSAWTRKKNPVLFQTELETLHRPPMDDFSPAYDNIGEAPDEPSFDPPYSSDPNERETSPVWGFSPTRKVIDIITIIYSTYRAVAAIIVNILALVVVNTRITLSSPSNLFLALLASQIQLQNFALPAALRLLLAFDVLLLAGGFGIASYARLHSPKLGYAELKTTGGNCPVYARNCFSQSTSWREVGCGNWTRLTACDDGDDDTADTGAPSSVPYATSGGSNTVHNPLHTIECVILVFGTVCLLAALSQVYNVRYIILPMKKSKRDTKRGRCHGALQALVPLFGTMGAVVAAFLSIGAHMGQELRPHKWTYLDSFGPVGGGDSWTDCFVLEAPGGMGWKGWMDDNGGVLWRVGALL